jgi:hypothetical protein
MTAVSVLPENFSDLGPEMRHTAQQQILSHVITLIPSKHPQEQTEKSGEIT